MSGTYTLAEIHERHVELEEIARGLEAARSFPGLDVVNVATSGDEPIPGRFANIVASHLKDRLTEVFALVGEDLARARAQLKRDATDAYVAFMGGE